MIKTTLNFFKTLTEVFKKFRCFFSYPILKNLFINGMNRTICCLSPVMNDGLNKSSPMRLNSASGFVNDCPSMPKATAAITSLKQENDQISVITLFQISYVVNFAANCRKINWLLNRKFVMLRKINLRLWRQIPSWQIQVHFQHIPLESCRHHWCKESQFLFDLQEKSAKVDFSFFSSHLQEPRKDWEREVGQPLK